VVSNIPAAGLQYRSTNCRMHKTALDHSLTNQKHLGIRRFEGIAQKTSSLCRRLAAIYNQDRGRVIELSQMFIHFPCTQIQKLPTLSKESGQLTLVGFLQSP
jgi:hypothetical protein